LFSFNVAHNGLGICEGRAFEIRLPIVSTNADSSTNVELLPSALLLQIPCACCTTQFYIYQSIIVNKSFINKKALKMLITN